MRALALVAMVGCGRIGFDEVRDTTLPGSDAANGSVQLVGSVEIDQDVTTSLQTAAFEVSAGSTLTAAVSCHYCASTAAIASLTGGGGTWQLAGAGPAGGIGGAEVVWLYYLTGATAGSTTIVLETVSDDWALEVSQWTGLTGSVDASGQLESDNGTTAMAPSLTTQHADDLILVAATAFPGSIPTGPTSDGSTFLPDNMGGNGAPLVVAYRIVTSVGTYATTWPTGGPPTYAIAVAFAGL